jgi:LEA14-like dessication related protein
MIDNKIVIVNGIKYDGNPEDVIRKLVQQIEELKEHRQSYYCVIPWKLLTDKTIPSTAKLLYGEISALTNKEGYCWASNDHFCQTFNIKNPNNISSLVRKLKEANYIYVEIEEGYKRKIWLQPPNEGVMKKDKGDYEKTCEGLMKKHNKDNINIDNNNYINNKEKKIVIVKKEKYPLSAITEQDISEIANQYHTSIGYVKLQLEKLRNYAPNKKGKPYSDYKAALRNFVLLSMERAIEKKQEDKYAPIDARNVK